jgi:hypothetical protein
MHDGVDSRERGRSRGGVTHVAAHELEAGSTPDVQERAPVSDGQSVENAHGPPSTKEVVDENRADVARSSRHEDGSVRHATTGHLLILMSLPSMPSLKPWTFG